MSKEKEKKEIGEIAHFFTNINVAVIKLSGTIKIGDKISIEGATTNIQQKVDSMQIDHKDVKEAKKGKSIGMKIKDRAREGDKVFKTN